MAGVSRSNLLLGLGFVAFALLVAFVWVPLDSDSGIIERVRGRYSIGDALAPTVAAGFILLGGLLLILFERNAPRQPKLTVSEIRFIATLLAICALSILIMRYAGPLLVDLTNLFRADPVEYRLLRATPGWRHIGFVLGGVTMITGIISVVEHGFSRRALLTGLLAILLLIAVFDLPFDDLLLPPNGDV